MDLSIAVLTIFSKNKLNEDVLRKIQYAKEGCLADCCERYFSKDSGQYQAERFI